MYKKAWTDFETHSLAFGLLRKALYPKYLVRGDGNITRIYRPTADLQHPELLITINFKSSVSKQESSFHETDIDCYFAVGGDTAYNILDHILPLLK